VTPDSAAVTVIMPVRNGERFVGAAVDSILAQTFTDFCLLAIDDASTDGTAGILCRYADPRLQVIRLTSRGGPAAARNAGLDAARSPLVAFFDSDDVAAPNRLDAQVTWLRAHPASGLLAGHVALIDEAGRRTGAVWGYDSDPDLIAPTLLFRNPLATSTVMVTRAAVGDERFDPALAIASDYDMWLRIGDRTSIACLPDLLAEYRDHAANVSHTDRPGAEICLETIARRRLARLGIEPSVAELRLHRQLGAGRVEGNEDFLRTSGAWLSKLERANDAAPSFPRATFRRVLAHEWLSVCEAAARDLGCRAWGQMGRSPLTRQIFREPSVRPRLARIPWRSLKTSLRRTVAG
jgi:glycosyltransferase involved in cell wall biosynthesis